MLKLTLKRGDAVHLVLADGTNGIIEARSRCETRATPARKH